MKIRGELTLVSCQNVRQHFDFAFCSGKVTRSLTGLFVVSVITIAHWGSQTYASCRWAVAVAKAIMHYWRCVPVWAFLCDNFRFCLVAIYKWIFLYQVMFLQFYLTCRMLGILVISRRTANSTVWLSTLWSQASATSSSIRFSHCSTRRLR